MVVEVSHSEDFWSEPEIPILLVKWIDRKQASFSRWLPHRRGEKVLCALWQILPCTFRFFFKGRIICGPGRPYWIYIAGILLACTVSFIIYDAIPYSESWTGALNGSITAFLVIVSISYMLRTITKDPGYMLPHWFSKQSTDPALTQNLIYSEIQKKYGFTSYCFICKIFQKPGTYHCPKCYACIDGFDHHCTLLGTCVGRRNYGDFVIFLLFGSLSLLFAVIVSSTHLVINLMNHGPKYAFSNCITLYLVSSTMFLQPGGLYMLAALPFYHLRLIFYGISLEQEVINCAQMKKKNGILVPDGKIFKLNWHEKLMHLCRNFYTRVIQSPPPSQIPREILELEVGIPAIPRTPLVQRCHVEMQNAYRARRIKIKFKSTWFEDIFTKYRIKLMQRDADITIGICEPLAKLIDQRLNDIQKGKAKSKRKNGNPVLVDPPNCPKIEDADISHHKTVELYSNLHFPCVPAFSLAMRKVGSGMGKIKEQDDSRDNNV